MDETWFPQYLDDAKHLCWNSLCQCAWRKAQLEAYKPNRQTLYENSHCRVSGIDDSGQSYVSFVFGREYVTVPREDI